MPNTPKIVTNEIIGDNPAADSQLGISGVIGRTLRGPSNRPDILITSWPYFKKIYGGESSTEEFPTLCRRALERGSALRVISLKGTGASKAMPIDSIKFSLSSSLVTGQTILFNPGWGFTVSQAFTGSSINTLYAFAQKVKAQYGYLFNDLKVTGATSLVLIPSNFDTTDFVISASGTTPPTVTKTNLVCGSDSAGNLIFAVTSKDMGDYSGLTLEILAPSNGLGYAFDLKVYIKGDDTPPEYYKNLMPDTFDTGSGQHWLDAVNANSSLINLQYVDITGYNGTPNFGAFAFDGGALGSALADTDYAGSQTSATGIYGFDKTSDVTQISALTTTSTITAQLFDAYVSNRRDMVHLIHLDNQYSDANALVAAKQGYPVDSSFSFFWAGGLVIEDALSNISGAERAISEMGDVLGCIALSDQQYGPQYSFSGKKRGKLINVKRIANDFGQNSNTLQLLAANQINLILKTGNIFHLWHSFTSQSAFNSLSYINVRRMLIALERALKPILMDYIEEPNDFITWKSLYLAVKPTLESFKANRAIFDYEWGGDQFATSLSNLTYNNEADVRIGKYHVVLKVKEIVSMQEITMDLFIAPSGVSFNDNLNTLI